MKKRKLKIKNVILFFGIFLFIIILLISKLSFKENILKINTGYLASFKNEVILYEYKEDELLESDKLIRGLKIKYYKENIEYDDLEYVKIKYNSKDYYVLKENVVSEKENVVLENELYVRTSNNLLLNLDYELGILLKKGDLVNIIGYNKLLSDGSVDLYKIKIDDYEGYYYGNYLVSTYEESIENYDQDGTYQIHFNRTNKLGGGGAGNLDYYPVSKVSFSNNSMPDEVYALYINGSSGIKDKIDGYIEYAKTTNINAFVVDIKDNQVPAYKSKVYELLSPTNYKNANNSIDDYKEAITKLKENGFYVIGRITTFKDNYYAIDNPDNAISSSDGTILKHSNSYWPSPYCRDVWYFNVSLAKEAVELFGFNEIQFDYVRFPDKISSYSNLDFKNIYNEEKAEVIQKFLMYATYCLHELSVYVSVDVFGESSWGYVTAYGQYWPAISNVVDVISAMPYTDHFGNNSSYWTNPYQTMLTWGKTASARQEEIPTPAIARTWITAYDTPYWKPTVIYDGEKLEEQIEGLYDAGLTGGYMTWNSTGNLKKYKTQFSAFNRFYKE